MPETRTPLQPKASEFHCSKDFCIKSTSITLLQSVSPTTLPKACIYMGEIRQFSKVREVTIVKEIKLNNLTNLPLARVFLCFNVEIHLRVCSRATREWFATIYKHNPWIHGFVTCCKEDSWVMHELYRMIVASTSQYRKNGKVTSWMEEARISWQAKL